MMEKTAEPAGRAGPPAHERVYRDLREMILFGAMMPGEAVTIQGLVERTGAGMTPVREALRRLTAEGALQALGNRRIAVPVLDRGAVEELLEARLALEPRVAARAARRADASDVAALSDIDRRLDAAIARGDIEASLRENPAFHARMTAVAGAPILTAMIETLWLRFGPSLRTVCGQFGTRQLRDMHKDLIAALDRRDPEAAAQALEGDVRQGMDLIAAAL
ncbi:GntR family transcriptional regulator [Rhodobacteraceae bacterium PD-2]|nr:GntR family transcriptional regulator [Rhodobacteraceae bacterium PD-2]